LFVHCLAETPCRNADTLQVPTEDVMRGLYFQTNFEIVHMKFARSDAFQGMFTAFDQTEVTSCVIVCLVDGFFKKFFLNANTQDTGIFEASLWRRQRAIFSGSRFSSSFSDTAGDFFAIIIAPVASSSAQTPMPYCHGMQCN
jgi:hypothetical protein